MDSSTRLKLMGGGVELVLYDIPGPAAGILFDGIREEALRLQGIFNLFDASSELSALNRERSIEASPELHEVVSMALPYCELMGGAYDISLGRQFIARKTGKAIPQLGCSYRDVEVDGGRISLEHPDALLDLGSIAKGYIGDKIIEHMGRKGVRSGFVDARGDMRVFGRHIEVVRIQHPRDKRKTLHPILLEESAVATSGDYNQYWGSYSRSHIVGETDHISATVAAPTLAQADALASCVFLAGSGGAGDVMAAHKEAKALTFTRAMEWHAYNGFQSMLLPEAEIGL